MIWLIPLIDDSQNVHITKLEAKKKTHNNNAARRHRCPIVSEETTNDGGFLGNTYLLLPFGNVTRWLLQE